MFLFLQRTGLKIKARSALFFFGFFLCVSKIVVAISVMTFTDRVAFFASFLAGMFDFHCYMVLLFAWLSVCESVFRFHSSKVKLWVFFIRALWLLPVLLSLDAFTQAIMEGALWFDLFWYRTATTYITFIITLPCTLIAAIVMLTAAVRVIVLLNRAPTSQNSSNSAIKRKIAITCIADSSLSLLIFVLQVASGLVATVSFFDSFSNLVQSLTSWSCCCCCCC